MALNQKKIIMNYSNLLTMQRYRKYLIKPNKSQNFLKEITTFSPNHSILVYFSCYHPALCSSLISLSSD